jgi:hypothetical protein
MQQFGHHNISINNYGTQVAQIFHLREQQGDNNLAQKDGPDLSLRRGMVKLIVC